LQLSIVLSGFAMDTNPPNNVASRLHHGALNGHADSEMQSADLPDANSHLSTIREMARDFQVSSGLSGFMKTAACCTRGGKAPIAGTMPATEFISR
jgi:hypothetical protein